MKVLIIPSWYVTEDKPNNGIFFKEQAQALSNCGVEVCVAYPDLRFKLGTLRRGIYKDYDADIPTYIYRKRTWTPFVEKGRWSQIYKMLEALYSRVVLEFGKPDVVHLQSCRIGAETVKLCKAHSLPLVYTEHYSGILKPMDDLLKYQFETTLKCCDCPIAVSEDLKAHMVSLRPDTLFIPNMVNTDEFKILPNVEMKANFVFAAVGNLTPIKGYEMLIEAFSKAAPKIPGARLYIAGSGEQQETLKQEIADFKLEDRVFLTGFLPRKLAPKFYNGCDCYVCSSNFETFGVSIIEALACGKPVIATRCGGPESIVSPKNGMLINSGNSIAMERALILMYRRAHEYNPFTIREDCMKRFGKNYVCQRIVQLYAHILKAKTEAAEMSKDAKPTETQETTTPKAPEETKPNAQSTKNVKNVKNAKNSKNSTDTKNTKSAKKV